MVVSNVTARPHGEPAEIRRRLVEQVTSPVRWEEGIRFLIGEGITRFIELGPGAALTGFMKRIDKGAVALGIGDSNGLDLAVKAITGS
jgi:[acyl-carrier-protein] S-malonyltransferase